MTAIAAEIFDNYKINLIDSMEGIPIEETPPGSSRTFQFTALGKDYKYTLEKYPENPTVQKQINTCVNYALTILKEQLPAIPTTIFTLSQKQIEQIKQRYPGFSKKKRLSQRQIEEIKQRLPAKEAFLVEIFDTEKNAQESVRVNQLWLDCYRRDILRWAIDSVEQNFDSAKILCVLAQKDDFESNAKINLKKELSKWIEEPSKWIKEACTSLDSKLSSDSFEPELNEKFKEIKNTLEAITQRSYPSQYMKNAEKNIQQLPSSQKRSNHYCHYIAAAVVTLVAGYFAYAYSSP